MVEKNLIIKNNPYFITVFFSLTSLFLLLYSFAFLDETASEVYAQTASSNGFKTYSNNEIKIEYPNEWTIPEDAALQIFKTENTTPIVGFFAPEESVGVVIAKEQQSQNITLDEELEETKRLTEKNQPDFHLIESDKIQLAGLPGYKILYKGTFDLASSAKRMGFPPELLDMFPSSTMNTTIMYFMTLRNGLIYTIGYQELPLNSIFPGGLPFLDAGSTRIPSSGTQDKFSLYLPLVQKMVDSFEIIGLNETNDGETKVISGQIDEKCQDYLDILKSRYVKGEITQEEFAEQKKFIGC